MADQTGATAVMAVRFGLLLIEMLQVCWRFVITRIVALKTVYRAWVRICTADEVKSY